MKNRRTAVVAVLLIAILCVGIGYALTSEEITFNGTINYTPEFSLIWSEVPEVAGDVTAAEISTDGTEASVTFTSTDWAVNSTHTFNAKVQNTSKYAGENLRLGTAPTDSEIYDYEVSFPNGSDIAANGGEQDVEIKITLKALPVSSTTVTETFNFTVVADQVPG